MKDPNELGLLLQAKELKKGDFAMFEHNIIADISEGVWLKKGETIFCLEVGSSPTLQSLFLSRVGFVHLWGCYVRLLS